LIFFYKPILLFHPNEKTDDRGSPKIAAMACDLLSKNRHWSCTTVFLVPLLLFTIASDPFAFCCTLFRVLIPVLHQCLRESILSAFVPILRQWWCLGTRALVQAAPIRRRCLYRWGCSRVHPSRFENNPLTANH